MATMILLPDDTGVSSSNWIIVGTAGTRHEALETDDGITSYVKCLTDTVSMIIEYANPSVAEGDIASIDSVRFLSSGKAIHRTDPSLVSIGYQSPSGNPAQICSYNAHRTSFETINGTARTTKDGTHAWDYAALESLELICTKTGTIEVYLSYLVLEVTYTEAVAADNATFFGANF